MEINAIVLILAIVCFAKPSDEYSKIKKRGTSQHLKFCLFHYESLREKLDITEKTHTESKDAFERDKSATISTDTAIDTNLTISVGQNGFATTSQQKQEEPLFPKTSENVLLNKFRMAHKTNLGNHYGLHFGQEMAIGINKISVYSRMRRNSKRRSRDVNICLKNGSCQYNKDHDIPLCYCDQACKIIQDCCHDSNLSRTFLNAFQIKSDFKLNYTSCVLGIIKDQYTAVRGYMMVTSCPTNKHTTLELAKNCSGGSSVINVPVSGDNGLAYRNKYCALCHNVHNYFKWIVKFNFDCSIDMHDLLNLNVSENVLLLFHKNGCDLDFIPSQHMRPRVCWDLKFKFEERALNNSLCLKYQNPIIQRGIWTRNIFCINDTMLDESLSFCMQPRNETSKFETHHLSALFDFNMPKTDKKCYSDGKMDNNSDFYFNKTIGFNNQSIGEDDHQNRTYLIKRTPLLLSNPLVSIVYLVLISTALVVGISGNTLILTIAACYRGINRIGKEFVVNLAVADLCVTAIAEPLCIVGVIKGQDFFDDYVWLCDLVASLCLTACFCAVITLTMLSLNRYIYVCHNVLYDVIYGRKMTIFLCVLCWVAACLCELPNFFGWGGHFFDSKNHQCIWDRTSSLGYTLFVSVGLIGTPLVTMSVFYVLIFKHIWKTKWNIYKFNTGDSTNSKKIWGEIVKASRTLFFIFMIYMICWAPYAVLIVVDMDNHMSMEIHLFVTFLAHLHSSANCVVFFICNREFRRCVGKMFTCQIKSNHSETDMRSSGNECRRPEKSSGKCENTADDILNSKGIGVCNNPEKHFVYAVNYKL